MHYQNPDDEALRVDEAILNTWSLEEIQTATTTLATALACHGHPLPVPEGNVKKPEAKEIESLKKIYKISKRKEKIRKEKEEKGNVKDQRNVEKEKDKDKQSRKQGNGAKYIQLEDFAISEDDSKSNDVTLETGGISGISASVINNTRSRVEQGRKRQWKDENNSNSNDDEPALKRRRIEKRRKQQAVSKVSKTLLKMGKFKDIKKTKTDDGTITY